MDKAPNEGKTLVAVTDRYLEIIKNALFSPLNFECSLYIIACVSVYVHFYDISSIDTID